eukprot:2804924-Lingulodinium_polyedra.AAC.1
MQRAGGLSRQESRYGRSNPPRGGARTLAASRHAEPALLPGGVGPDLRGQTGTLARRDRARGV